MSNTQSAPEGKDPALWEIARKRAGFKKHLASYIVVNLFLWGVWYFSGHKLNTHDSLPWPAWSTMGWGIGLAFHFIGAYISPTTNTVENEYQKLKNQQNK